MKSLKHSLTAFLLLLALAGGSAAAEKPGLKEAWADKNAVRSVFFIEGMACRACSMILDRKINNSKGVYWARFNFPMRLFTIYHDPKAYPTKNIENYMDGSAELKAVLLSSAPAAKFKPTNKSQLASWKGGKADVSEMEMVLRPFKDYLNKELGDTPEKVQLYHEILGEAMRNRALAQLAKSEGFNGDTKITDLPNPIVKDFYWTDDIAAPSRDDRAITEYLTAKVLTEKVTNEMEAFDLFLLDFWKKSGMDFRGEYLEAGLK